MNPKNYIRHMLNKGITVGRVAKELAASGRVFNPLQPLYRSAPYADLAKFRARAPIHRSYLVDGWFLTRYEDVLEVLSGKKYGSDQRKLRRWPELNAQMKAGGLSSPYETGLSIMMGEDPPDHTRTRRFASKAFTPQSYKAMRPNIEAMRDEVLSNIPESGVFDFVSTVSSPFPIAVIASILGVPFCDWEQFHSWSVNLIKMLSLGESAEHGKADSARRELFRYLSDMAEDRRKSPRDDAITALVQAQAQEGGLSDKELISIAIQLLVAGNVTTTRLITNSTLALLRNPQQLKLLQDNPELVPQAVEEFLRLDAPIPFVSRIVLEDHLFRGRPFTKGQMIILSLSSANRDPDKFENPDQLDIRRTENHHLSFSHGPHFCLGARLARMEGALALERLVNILPNLKLSDRPIDWGSSTILFGPEKLWLQRN